MKTVERMDVIDKINFLLEAWQSADTAKINTCFSQDVVFDSSAHGLIESSQEVTKKITPDFVGHHTTLCSSNHFAARISNSNNYVFTTYIYGQVKANAYNTLVFGATATGSLSFDGETLMFSRFKFSVNWMEGNNDLLRLWVKPRMDRFWRAGDLEKNLISELDAPWHKYRHLESLGTPEELLKQSYAKYSWAIDQADFILLSSMFTPDAYGDFTPMGMLSGKHQIISTMKDFRQPWPYMQHFGEALSADFNEDQTEARLIIGRLIPQQYSTVFDQKKYGAHYDLKMKKTGEVWQIHYFTYKAGWFSGISDLIPA